MSSDADNAPRSSSPCEEFHTSLSSQSQSICGFNLPNAFLKYQEIFPASRRGCLFAHGRDLVPHRLYTCKDAHGALHVIRSCCRVPDRRMLVFLGLDQRPQLGSHAGAPSVKGVQCGCFYIMLNAWHVLLACPCRSGCTLTRLAWHTQSALYTH